MISPRERQRLQNITREELQAMSPEAFRTTVTFLLRALGYHVNPDETTDDPRVDLLAWDVERKPWVVQIRRELTILDEPHVRQFVALLHELEIERGILVMPGTMTPAARAWTRRAHVYLWDGERLTRMVQLAAGKRWKVETTPSHEEK
ncbi:MAG: restriction endonuclease [Ardenticatenia bacterium]|nr:restriction endonuclease [Ardenticatenia bacterium]